MLYTSTQNTKIKEIKKLHQKKYRDLTNRFLVEGEHLVLEAYKSGYLKTLIVLDNVKYPDIDDIIIVTLPVMKYLSQLDNPPTMIGICSKLNKKDIGNRVVILDNIQDPGNLGTIIRSAVAFNVDTIILSKDTVDVYNEKVLRASQGLIFYINIVVDDIIASINTLKQSGFTIIGTKVAGGESLAHISHDSKLAIIMGNEGNGISDRVSSLCDKFIYINMNKKCESLNVGVATSIILYELDK